ncbi:MAG TPA: sigma-70 family RNA polymerase sigma factor [Gemmatimonadaceae bacterium]|nr:sigma-70 family RNA polymerase sigma factor [Gemmatimonadaceae bacterium]
MTSSAVAVEAKRHVNREPELIARVVAGDRQAAREMYDAHAPRVFRLAFRFTGDQDLAQELTQETFIRAFAQLGRFRGDSALSTWLHRVTISVVSNSMRKVNRFRSRETDLDEASPMAAETRVADPDLRDKLYRAIDELPDIYRTAFLMHDLEGYTHEEIANVLGVAEGTCKSRLSVARAQLREKLAPYAKEWLE